MPRPTIALRTLGAALGGQVLRVLVLIVTLLCAQQFTFEHAIGHLAEQSETGPHDTGVPEHGCDVCQVMAALGSALATPEFSASLCHGLQFAWASATPVLHFAARARAGHNRDPPFPL